eukprot:62097_1
MSVDEETLKILESEASKCRIPNENSMYVITSLYTNLSLWKSYGRDYVTIDSNKTGQKHCVYQKNIISLNHKKMNQEPTTLGIGIDGGFSGK